MIKDNEKVTIICVTHNNSSTIERALQSLTVNLRKPNHIVIGDNDSKDGTYELLCKILGAQEVEVDGKHGLPPKFDGTFNEIPITIFRKKLSTTGHSLNTCLFLSPKDTTIFGFIDPACWYNVDKIIRSINTFYSFGNAIICVVSDCDYHHADGRIVRIFRQSFTESRLLAEYLYDKNFFIRSIAFNRLGSGFNEQLNAREDYDFLLRISEFGLIYHLPEPLHNCIVNNNEDPSILNQCEYTIRKSTIQRRSNGIKK